MFKLISKIIPLALLGMTSKRVFAHSDHSHSVQTQGRCQTNDPTEEEKAETAEVMRRWAAAHPEGSYSVSLLSAYTTEIPTFIHIINPTSGTENEVTKDNAQGEIDALNVAFGNSPFKFILVETIEHVNDSWFAGDEFEMKASTRIGDCSTLNIWFNDGDLGYATFPDSCGNSQSIDGVVCKHSSKSGGTFYPYNEGDTLVHEVGHWMGLYHTFQGGCTGSGDSVADTPAVATPNFGCPVGKDSCPADSGVDQITNFMDYTDDSCMEKFTPGQIDRMTAMYTSYRGELATDAPSDISSDSPSQGNPGPSPDGPWYIDLYMDPFIESGVLYVSYLATETTKHEVMTFAGDCATPADNVFAITSTTTTDDAGSMFIDAELSIDIDAIIANEDIYTGDATSGVAVFCVEASVWRGSDKIVAHDTVYTGSVNVVEGFFILEDVNSLGENPSYIDDLDIGYEGQVDVYHCNTDTFEEITPGPLGPGDKLAVCVWNLASSTNVEAIYKMDLIQASTSGGGVDLNFNVIEDGVVDSGNKPLIDIGCDDALSICYASIVLIDTFFQSGVTTKLNVEGEAILGSAKEEEDGGAFSLTVDLKSCTDSGLIGVLNRAIFGK